MDFLREMLRLLGNLFPERIHEIAGHIRKTPSTRNDFMSHGSYMFLGTIAFMAFVAIFDRSMAGISTWGLILGIAAAIAREAYDRRDHNGWDWYDLLSAFSGIVAALVLVNFIAWRIV